MKAYLKFAASFWMSAFLAMGSMTTAQSNSTARAKKSSAANAAPVPQL
jgi:DNA-binding transcriptional regulator WhiA